MQGGKHKTPPVAGLGLLKIWNTGLKIWNRFPSPSLPRSTPLSLVLSPRGTAARPLSPGWTPGLRTAVLSHQRNGGQLALVQFEIYQTNQTNIGFEETPFLNYCKRAFVYFIIRPSCILTVLVVCIMCHMGALTADAGGNYWYMRCALTLQTISASVIAISAAARITGTAIKEGCFHLKPEQNIPDRNLTQQVLFTPRRCAGLEVGSPATGGSTRSFRRSFQRRRHPKRTGRPP
jgi:hypothetical protein